MYRARQMSSKSTTSLHAADAQTSRAGSSLVRPRKGEASDREPSLFGTAEHAEQFYSRE